MSLLSGRRLIDLTIPLGPDTPRFPGDRGLMVRKVSDLLLGDPTTLSEVTLGCHLGTHVDAPAHFIKRAQLVSDYSVGDFLGPAFVVSVEGTGAVTRAGLEAKGVPKRTHVLIKTQNSTFVTDRCFHNQYVHLDPDAARFMVEDLECLSVGFDYYSLDPADSTTFPAHTIVARAGKLAFVCLNLREAGTGPADFIALPPRLEAVEGAPVRAILIGVPGSVSCVAASRA